MSRRTSKPIPLHRFLREPLVRQNGMRHNEHARLFFQLALKWEEIAGKKNVRYMHPAAVRGNTLVIAVPNAMVKSSIYPVIPLLLERIHEQGERFSVITVLSLKVSPAAFPRSRRSVQPKKYLFSPDTTALQSMKRQLSQSGMSEETSAVAARFYLLCKYVNSLD